MKRILLIVAILCATVCANAQRITFWYGINYGKESNNSLFGYGEYEYLPNFPDQGKRFLAPYGKYGKKVRPINLGIDCTSHLSGMFDWTAGIGFNQKGSFCKIHYMQVEESVQYNLFKKNSWTVSQFVGLFEAIKITGNDAVKAEDDDGTVGDFNKYLFGFQFGVNASYKRLSLKVGYEQLLTNIGEKVKTFEWFARLGISIFGK